MREFYEDLVTPGGHFSKGPPPTFSSESEPPSPDGESASPLPSGPSGEPPSAGPPEPRRPFTRCALAAWLLAALIILGVGAGLGWYYWGGGKGDLDRQESLQAPAGAKGETPASPEASTTGPGVEELLNQGRSLFKEGRYAEAIGKLEEALANDPKQAEGHYYLGAAYLEATRYLEAVETLKKALEIRPEFAQAYEALGRAYYLLDQNQDAVSALEQALKLDPSLTEARYYLGLAHLGEGRRQKAQEQYEALKNLAPEKAALLKEHLGEPGSQSPVHTKPSPSPPALSVTPTPRWPWTSHRRVTPADLAPLSPEELKLMRYEILARKGWVFASPDLRDYFQKQPWYQPKGTQEQAGKVNREILGRLKPLERRNAAAILRYEMKLRKQGQ